MQTKFNRAAIAGLTGIALFATAAPAFARDPDPKAARPTTTKPIQATGSQRYCVDAELTGSRVKRRACLTASEWSAQGVDIVKEAENGARR